MAARVAHQQQAGAPEPSCRPIHRLVIEHGIFLELVMALALRYLRAHMIFTSEI